MLINVLENIIKGWGDDTVALLKQYHIEAGQKATGNAEKEFKDEIKSTKSVIDLTISGADYVENLSTGTPPGKNTTVAQMLNWINAKGITPRTTKLGMAIGTARKINKVGSLLYRTGRTFSGASDPVSKAINRSRLDALAKLLEDNLVIRVESDTLEQFRTGKI